MEKHWLERTEQILGQEALKRLAGTRVAVFGLGGVGGHCAEALARSGIGALDLIDMDSVEETNLNRQLIALRSTLGKRKTDVMRDRILDIDPETRVVTHDLFYLPETADQIPLDPYDYVVDAIDNVTAKVYLAKQCLDLGIPLISCLGTGNRLDPSRLRVTDIFQTAGDPLARAVRSKLRKEGIDHLTVVFSDEKPVRALQKSAAAPDDAAEIHVPHSPGSTAFVPAAAGLLMASFVVRELSRQATGDVSHTTGKDQSAL